MRSSATRVDGVHAGRPDRSVTGGRGAAAVPGTAGPEPAGRIEPGVRIVASALTVLLLAASATPASAQPRSEDGAAAAWAEESARHHGYPAVAASALSDALSEITTDGTRLTARVDGRSLELMAGSPFYRVDGRVAQLANPPYRRDGGFWLPLQLLERLGVAGAEAARAAAHGSGGEARPGRTGPWKVVIDPGHGGKDSGARGPGGVQEKEVVLGIARRLVERLNRRDDVEASLTRTDDRFLPLDQRSRIAVQRDADLFLSLHANAARDRSARGFETYFLGEARTERARRVALRENSSVRYEGGSGEEVSNEVQMILANMDLNMFQEESRFLAGYVQNSLRSRISSPDRGVKQNIFLVLVNASGSMPSILVETGFISNPQGERRLRSGDGQARIADGIGQAIVEYFRERERRETVQTAARR